MKFNLNMSGGSRVVACGRTDMTKLMVAFRNFENAPKNDSFCTVAKGAGIASLEQPLSYGMF
jgi:hypothetical protein